MKVRIAVGAAALLFTLLLASCTSASGDPTSSESTPAPGASATTDATPTPSPTPTSTPVPIPDDCREILSDAVLDDLADIPLNDPAAGPSGVQDDGSLLCVWRDVRADTTALTTEISYKNRGPALDMLNALADDEGFTCFTPDDGTRCEKTWPNETYPVTDGRTLFWREDVLIDTTYSNLAPSGYTSSIVAHLFD